MHVQNSYFRMPPNPTFYHWDTKFFNMRELLLAYDNNINDINWLPWSYSPNHINLLQNKSGIVARALRAARNDRGENGFTHKLLNELHEALRICDKYLTQEVHPDVVERVLREHIQIVLHKMNERSSDDPIDFVDLDGASPELKQNMFMDIYFATILPEVVKRATEPLADPNSTRSELKEHYQSRPAAESAPASPTAQFTPPTALSRIQTFSEWGGNDNSAQATNTWCTLVFRMLCWLLLHDFHRNDVQIAKSELLGSRLPVYII